MGIALSTLSSALPHSLQQLARWLHNLVRLEEAPRVGAATSPPPGQSHQPSDQHTAGDKGGMGSQRPAGSPGLRPLRGNWPFTVQPPAPEPKAVVARPSLAANRSSFLGTAGGSNRDAFMASIASGALPQRSSSAVRKVSHASGRLVIAGRMADVCAELDRMAACEALQA